MSNILSQMSDDLAATVEKAGAGVVRVEARRRLPASGIVWQDEGVIVTAHHVIETDDNIGVGLPNGETVEATLAGRDPSTDVAVLRANIGDLPVATLADPDMLKVGHLTLALGRPGRDVRATLGMVNAIYKSRRARWGRGNGNYIQSEITMYPGFSGGPLVDVGGGVLGMNTSALFRGAPATIPLQTLEQVVESLLMHGRVRKGYLGIGAQPVRLQRAASERLNRETGLLITSVEPDTPAAKGGLLVGDTLVSLDGMQVRHLDDLLTLLGSDKAGKSASIEIIRAGQFQRLDVTIVER